MFNKKKLNEVKTETIKLMKERPLETIAVATGAALAVAKVIESVSGARNSATWRREVKRREAKQKNK